MPSPAPPTSTATTPRRHWQHRLVAAWSHRGPLACLLWPLSLLVRLAWEVRVRAHSPHAATGPKTTTAPASPLPPVPWVVVGNVVVGGAGKTPTTMALVRHWQQAGRHPAVVSKGHGRSRPEPSVDHPFLVLDDTPASQSGDEPLLIRQTTHAPVVVGPDRQKAGLWLLQQHPEVDVLVCDDGLQDFRLNPAARVTVFDERGVGNGWMLPAGLLRQPWPPKQHSPGDVALLTGGQPLRLLPMPAGMPVFHAQRTLTSCAYNPLGVRRTLASLASGDPPTGCTGTDPGGRPDHRPCMALAGIARPQAFFDMLEAAGVTLSFTVALKDHQPFDHEFCSYLLNEYKRYRLFLTEKDAIKLFPLLRQMPTVTDDVWAVPLKLELPTNMRIALDARLSSVHGSKAA